MTFKDIPKHSFNGSDVSLSMNSIGKQKLQGGGFSITRFDDGMA